MFTGNFDKLVIEIAIDTGSRNLPVELFVCKRKELKSKMKSLDSLEICKGSNAKNYRLSEKDMANKNSLTIMSEHDEIAN